MKPSPSWIRRKQSSTGISKPTVAGSMRAKASSAISGSSGPREREDLPASSNLVVGELLRRALPAEVPARVRDGAAVAALLPVEPQVLLFLAHGRGHTGKRAHDLRLDVAAEVEELAVVRERHSGS